MGKVDLGKILDLDPDFVTQKCSNDAKIASASGNFHEIMRACNAGNTHLIKTISCFLIGYYNKIFNYLNAQWTTDCTEERTLPRF